MLTKLSLIGSEYQLSLTMNLDYPVPRLVPDPKGSKFLGLYNVKSPLSKQSLKCKVQIILGGTWPRVSYQCEYIQVLFGRFL